MRKYYHIVKDSFKRTTKEYSNLVNDLMELINNIEEYLETISDVKVSEHEEYIDEDFSYEEKEKRIFIVEELAYIYINENILEMAILKECVIMMGKKQ